MRVLLLGSDCPLGLALVDLFERQSRHELVAVTAGAARWKNERQTKKAVRRASPGLVVDIRIEAEAGGVENINELDLKRCRWIAKACQRDDAGYLFVSNSRVFSGTLGRPYSENDEPDADDGVGKSMADAESRIKQRCERHLILRLGWVFNNTGPGMIAHILGSMADNEPQVLDNCQRGGPVASSDGARVIAGLVDQLSTGEDLWGVYHYASADTATHYEFTEAVLSVVSRSLGSTTGPVELATQADDFPSLNRALDSSLIRNTFAIKQLMWHDAIVDLVASYYDQQSEENC